MKKTLKRMLAICLIVTCLLTSNIYATEQHPEIKRVKVTTTQIVKSCQKVGKTMTKSKIRYAWKKYHGVRQPNLKALLKQKKRYSHCGDYVAYVLQNLGLISKDRTFVTDGYGNIRASYMKNGKMVYASANSPISLELKEQLETNFYFLKSYTEKGKTYKLAGKKVKNVRGLKRGDIVLMCSKNTPTTNIFSAHLMIYDSGVGKHTKWYNGGSATLNRAGYLNIGTRAKESKYNESYITMVLRHK